jgi:hypothetical protein
VRLIFEQFASGKSLRGVCRYLIENGIPTPKAQREDSTRRMRGLDGWLSSTIKSILSNTTHYGQAAFGKTRRVADESRLQNGFKNPYTVVRVPPEEWIYIDCPAIVSRELWDQCNRRLKSNNALFGGNPQRKYMLSGLLRCPKCERTMAASSRQRPYQPDGVKEVSYCCKDANPAWNMQGVVCFPHHFRGLKLEAEVITAIVGLTTDPAQLERAYEEWKRKLQPVAANAGKNIQRKLDALAKKELATAEAQIEARMKGEGTAVYDTILSSIAQQRKILLSQQEEISMARRAATDAQHVQQKIEWFAQTAKDVSEVLSAEVIEPGEKQKILSLIIEKIYPDAKGKLTIYFHPFEAGRQWVWQRGKLRVEELKPAN